MTCSECQEILLDPGCRLAMDPHASAHARQCPACAVFQERQKFLTAGLAALATRETRRPPASIEEALLRELQPVRAGRWKMAGIAGVAAAAAVAFLWLPRPASQPLVVKQAAAQVVSIAAVAPQATEAPRRPHRSRPRRLHAIPAEPETASGFVDIPYAAPLEPTERAELVHVNMPVAALAAWGLPLPAVDPGLRVNADLVLGENGLARAVRLVR